MVCMKRIPKSWVFMTSLWPALALMLVTTSGCRRVEQRYDPFGSYKSCQDRVSQDRVEEDIHAAVARKDYRFFWVSSNGDFMAITYAPGVETCNPKSNAVFGLKAPAQAPKITVYDGHTPAQNCQAAISRYEEKYNVWMARRYPVSIAQSCQVRIDQHR